MKAKELREKSKEELEELLKGERTRLTQVRFDISARQHKNHRDLEAVKRSIARVLTVMGEEKTQENVTRKQLKK